MEKIDRELIIKDMCARIPYGVKVCYKHPQTYRDAVKQVCYDTDIWELVTRYHGCCYLRPMSSMTEEEANYMLYTLINDRDSTKDIKEECKLHALWNSKLMDWLIAGHFDFRGLIEKGLAIDCTNLNIY